jgi:hypothetical protein
MASEGWQKNLWAAENQARAEVSGAQYIADQMIEACGDPAHSQPSCGASSPLSRPSVFIRRRLQRC